MKNGLNSDTTATAAIGSRTLAISSQTRGSRRRSTAATTSSAVRPMSSHRLPVSSTTAP